MRVFALLAVLGTSGALLDKAGAVTVLIDFGIGTQAAPSPYNLVTYTVPNASDVTTGAVALFDTTTASTGWTITVTETGSGTGGNAGSGANVPGPFPAAVAGFNILALQDSLFANNGGGSAPAMTVTVAGLNPSYTYNLLLFGSRNAMQNVDQRWSLTQGTGGGVVTHGSELNTTTAVDWGGIAPNGSGVIAFLLDTVPGGDSVGALALNFGSITEVVPEPSAVVFLMCSAFALIVRRRR